jgi:hypothetical protein
MYYLSEVENREDYTEHSDISNGDYKNEEL